MEDVGKVVIVLPGGQWRIQKDRFGSFALAALKIPGEDAKDQEPSWEMRSWHRTAGLAATHWVRKHSRLEPLEAESIEALVAAEEKTRDMLIQLFGQELEVSGAIPSDIPASVIEDAVEAYLDPRDEGF